MSYSGSHSELCMDGTWHYNDVMMAAIASQITGLTIVYSSVCSGKDKRKHQRSASLAFVRGIPRWPVNFPHKWPVTRKMFYWMTSSRRNHRARAILCLTNINLSSSKQLSRQAMTFSPHKNVKTDVLFLSFFSVPRIGMWMCLVHEHAYWGNSPSQKSVI